MTLREQNWNKLPSDAEKIPKVYRKGELSPAGADRGWPYQVALDADLCKSQNHDTHREFNGGLSLCSRGHSVSYYEGKWYHVLCYSLKEDTEALMAAFGGEWFDPGERGKGANWMRWSKGSMAGKSVVR